MSRENSVAGYALEYGWEVLKLALESITDVLSLDHVTLSHIRDGFSGLVSNV